MSPVWLINLHRFERDEVSGASMRRHSEVARLDGDLQPAAVVRFVERWYAEHYQPQWIQGAEIDERAVMNVGGDIEVGHEPKLTARLGEV